MICPYFIVFKHYHVEDVLKSAVICIIDRDIFALNDKINSLPELSGSGGEVFQRGLTGCEVR